MHHAHITRELLRAEVDDRQAGFNLFRTALSHLYHFCPVCRAEARAYYAEAMEQDELDFWHEEMRQVAEGGYDRAFERVATVLAQTAPKVEAARELAASQFAELLALPAARRLEAITGAPLVYRGQALASFLLDASLEQMPGKPREALSLAQLAKAVLSHSGLSGLVTELYARASAHVGNALRTLGRLPEASAQFDDARFLLRHHPGFDPLISAEMDRLEGSLRRDQRRFEDAEQLLQRAALSYEMATQPREAALTLLKLGGLYFEQGNPTEASNLANRALDSLDPEEEPRLCMYARQNLADCLCEQGYYEEARESLADNHAAQQQHGDSLSHLRLQWVEGKIAHGLGDRLEAETLFLLARHGFEKHGIPCDAALVSLELAALYLEQGRTAEVKALAAEMVEIFDGQEIHREAATALHLFRDAAQLEQVTVAWVRGLATYLVRASRDPSFSFQASS